jgi:N-acetylmuramoyl-L-alanine amidase
VATPLSADKMVSALRAEGVRVQEYRSWRTHNRNHKGAWGGVNGVMIHHTVTRDDDSSVALCYNGHSALPGPLCHAVGRNDGTVTLVSNGRANHAGMGDDDVLRAVINETLPPPANEANTDGNARFYGIELVNMGDGVDRYTPAQYDAAVRWAAAICRAHGWSAKSVIGHKEWQPGKIDPRGPVDGKGPFDMDVFRSRVQVRLNSGPSTLPAPESPKFEQGETMTPEEIHAAVWSRDAVPAPSTSGTVTTNPTWKAESYLAELFDRTTQLNAKLDSLQDQLAFLVDALTEDPA